MLCNYQQSEVAMEGGLELQVLVIETSLTDKNGPCIMYSGVKKAQDWAQENPAIHDIQPY